MRATMSAAGVSSDPPSSSEATSDGNPANPRPVAVSAAAVTMSRAFTARACCQSFDATIAGGDQVPLPAGRMEGPSVFGQYRRITR